MPDELRREGPYERHVFVCMHERAGAGAAASCGARGSAGIHARLKDLAKRAGLGGRIRINRAGCLDRCEFGPVVVVYPENVWYGRVSAGDEEDVVSAHLLDGRPVERLLLSNDELRPREV